MYLIVLSQHRRNLTSDQIEAKQQETINELTDQLEYERLRREKLEALLDNYKREINHLNRALDNTHMQSQFSDEEVPISRKQRARQLSATKKSGKKKPTRQTREDNYQNEPIRRNSTRPTRPIV